MTQVRGHRDLVAWQEAMAFAREVYRVTRSFPGHEQFSLTSQVRRAAISIPSNIAEGAARESAREFVRFLGIARGSLAEVETQLLLAADLDYWDPEPEVYSQMHRLFKLISSLMKTVGHPRHQKGEP